MANVYLGGGVGAILRTGRGGGEYKSDKFKDSERGGARGREESLMEERRVEGEELGVEFVPGEGGIVPPGVGGRGPNLGLDSILVFSGDVYRSCWIW